MKKSFCELVLDYFPRISHVGNLYTTNILNCVFNSFLCYTTIRLNIVTIHAIRKTPSLPKNLKTLLLSLAVSDVGVGFVVQPVYISLLVKWLQKMIPNCSTYNWESFRYSFFPLRCSCKCRQVLSYSSSSQIPGTCDSQACCCYGYLNMSV